MAAVWKILFKYGPREDHKFQHSVEQILDIIVSINLRRLTDDRLQTILYSISKKF